MLKLLEIDNTPVPLLFVSTLKLLTELVITSTLAEADVTLIPIRKVITKSYKSPIETNFFIF